MTLIITKTSIHYSIIVADRLLTVVGSGDPFDTRANKCIVFGARDGIIAIAYSGFGYIGEVPSDQWIAERLIGEVFSRSERLPAICFRDPKKALDIGRSIERLRTALNNAKEDIPLNRRFTWANMSMDVLAVGWQWYRRKRPRPVMIHLGKRAGSNSFMVNRTSRHEFSGGRFRIGVIPGEHVTQDELSLLSNEVSSKAPNDVEQILGNFIVEKAEHVQQIGNELTSILVTPPNLRRVLVRFLSSETPTELIRTGYRRWSRASISYSPWILCPGVVSAPSRVVGGGHVVECGGYRVELQGQLDPNILGAFSSQSRPRQP